MELWQVISAVILGFIAIVLFLYVYFTSREKGPILSNTYLFASMEDRSKINKSTEYHLVTIVFSLLGIIFLLLAVSILTTWTWLNFFVGLFVIILIVYAVVNAIKSETNH